METIKKIPFVTIAKVATGATLAFWSFYAHALLKNSNQYKTITTKCIAIELGGTGLTVAYGKRVINKQNQVYEIEIIDKEYFRTLEDPKKTLDQILKFTQQYEFDDVCLASFGPLCLKKNDPKYGSITQTPKKGWDNFFILKYLSQILKHNKNIYFETDVNACGLAEYKYHKQKSTIMNSLIYVTVGTGVGTGIIINGQPVHGMMHPEGGHMMIPKHEKDSNFTGVCSFHQNCLEGLVSNVSIAKRKGLKDVMEVKNISDDDEIWDLIAHYLSVFCANLTYICSPEVIVIGGGIMNRKILFDKIRNQLNQTIKDYPVLVNKQPKNFILESSQGNNIGIKGAMMLTNN